MLNRRDFLIGAGAACLAVPALAHTPYGQWVVYRQKHLLIGAHRGDSRTYVLATSVVDGLARELPEASARVARGPRPQRIASLIATGQLFLAVLSSDEARRMSVAAEPFDGYRPTPVHVLADLGHGYFLFAAPDFPVDHALQVTEALDHAGLGDAPGETIFTVHAGASGYWAQKPH